MNELTQQIAKVITELQLDKPNRKRQVIHRKMYLISLLRANGMKLKPIGDMFNMDYSTVIHSLSRYKDLKRFKDALLCEDTRALRGQFGEHLDTPVFSIVYDMRNATGPYDFKVIRERLENKVYIDVKY